MEMEWKENMSKDFSFVVWGTGSDGSVSITSDYEETNQSTLPFTSPLDGDQNAAQESGADICAVNPQHAGFEAYYNSFEAWSSEGCNTAYSWSTHGNGDFFYTQRGGCGDDALMTMFSFPQSVWDDIWYNEGAVLMETSAPDAAGLVTKTFRLKVGGPGDRVAFFVQAKHGLTTADV